MDIFVLDLWFVGMIKGIFLLYSIIVKYLEVFWKIFFEVVNYYKLFIYDIDCWLIYCIINKMVDDVFDFVIIKKVCICYNLMRNVLFDKKKMFIVY